ncbi:hypothetical protein [Corynebacterium sp. ES2715-CONJ3]|uniref:hypothetical protein n=1 Tax=Corynebacterium sp. ES2715-CONJ3 TaxID=2974028 RepID=UPI00216A6E80|nr:hypothetical protein [Corynebacterium sp. ES2715-CONJ3]MCS4491552.1 hypothetical protein [Corynebacterium sp. ES2715-CONJ3]
MTGTHPANRGQHAELNRLIVIGSSFGTERFNSDPGTTTRNQCGGAVWCCRDGLTCVQAIAALP